MSEFIESLAVTNRSIAKKNTFRYCEAKRPAILKFAGLNLISSFIISHDLQGLMSKVEVSERNKKKTTLFYIQF